jgi:hypothetical protein
VGQGGEVTADPAYDGAAALHRKTMADVETLGAGLCDGGHSIDFTPAGLGSA